MSRLFPFVAVCALLAACAAPGDEPAAGAPPEAAVDTPARTATEPEQPPPVTPEDPEEAATEPDAAPTGPGATADEPGTPAALAFEAPLLDGGAFTGSDHDGRDVALWFWAPW